MTNFSTPSQHQAEHAPEAASTDDTGPFDWRAMADPHGLLRYYIWARIDHTIPARDVYILWLLSLRPRDDAAIAAKILVAGYGDILEAAGRKWHRELLGHLNETAHWPEARLRKVRRHGGRASA